MVSELLPITEAENCLLSEIATVNSCTYSLSYTQIICFNRASVQTCDNAERHFTASLATKATKIRQDCEEFSSEICTYSNSNTLQDH